MFKNKIILLFKKLIISILSFTFSISCTYLYGQSLPIAIDSQFDDWMDAASGYNDQPGDGASLDLLEFEVANDENYLFLNFMVDKEIILTEDNELLLYLDTDNNPLTGKITNGFGAELEIRFGEKIAWYYSGNSGFSMSLNNVKFHHQPTVSSKVFEIAIGRNVFLAGNKPLFTGNTLRILFRNGVSGDMMPDTGQTYTYTFDNFPAPAFQPVDLKKDKPHYIRLLTWNTLQNGLGDFSRKEYFKRVLSVLKPDIITFNECWDVPPGMAATLMNEAVPLGNFQSWKAVKLDQGSITVSRFPILQNWLIYPNHRLTASLIDLPDNLYNTNLLVINGHLKCCSEGNDTRQLEADAFAAFILDAKSPGGVISLPEGTPFVLSGDLNLVGWQQQLTTLLTGETVNKSIFGPGGPLDWDNTPLLDIVAIQADQRMAYTWKSYNSDYPPSRIDYHICSNSVMDVKKAFTLETESMSEERLATYNLQQDDTYQASDHLPKVTDFELGTTTAYPHALQETFNWKISPNPVGNYIHFQFYLETPKGLQCTLLGVDGRTIKQWLMEGQAGLNDHMVDLSGIQPGMYLMQTRVDNRVGTILICK